MNELVLLSLLTIGYVHLNSRLKRLEEQVIKQQVIDQFKQKRKSAGYPCQETYNVVFTGRPLNNWIIKKWFTLGYQNIKAIYIKNHYPGTISLIIGGQHITTLYDNGTNYNLLDSIDGKLLLGLLKYHETWLLDSLGILMQDDIIIEYHDEVDNETFKQKEQLYGRYIQYFTNIYGKRQKIIYSHGMAGVEDCKIFKTREQRQQEHLVKKQEKAVRREKFIKRMLQLGKIKITLTPI